MVLWAIRRGLRRTACEGTPTGLKARKRCVLWPDAGRGAASCGLCGPNAIWAHMRGERTRAEAHPPPKRGNGGARRPQARLAMPFDEQCRKKVKPLEAQWCYRQAVRSAYSLRTRFHDALSSHHTVRSPSCAPPDCRV